MAAFPYPRDCVVRICLKTMTVFDLWEGTKYRPTRPGTVQYRVYQADSPEAAEERAMIIYQARQIIPE
jgi:hypothetical protein